MTLLAVLAAILGALLLLEKMTGRSDGFASGRELRRTLGWHQLKKRAKVLRPGIKPKTPNDLGLRLGRSKLWGSIEDSFLVVGPPRAGKGRDLIIPWVTSYPGHCIVTSTRDDLVRGTANARANKGPLWLFDPSGVVRCNEARDCQPTRWDLTAGCEDPLTAILRSHAMVAASHSHDGVKHGDFWQATSETILRCLLHAAAVGGRDIRDVLRWVSQQNVAEAQEILGEGGLWVHDLAGLIQLKDESRTSVFASAQMCLNCLADPRVLAAVSADGNFDVDEFLKSQGTLYVVGTSEAQHSMAPVVVALLEAIVQRGKQLAMTLPGSRLDPPLGLFLDEAANIAPIPSLPKLVADGGGTGITPVVVLQSLAQARDRWGVPAAETIWDGCNVKLIFGGLGNHDDLQKISRLCGEIEQRHGKEASMVRSKAALSLAQIRGLKPWRALLLYKGLRPAVLRLRPTFGGSARESYRQEAPSQSKSEAA